MPLALGTDTGGSIRVPSCWCGTTGLKPSRELVSRQGVAPLSWTLDHVGPMARSAEDIARVLPFMACDRGAHLAGEVAALLQTGSVQGLRIGIPVNWFTEKVDQQVLANWQAALKQFGLTPRARIHTLTVTAGDPVIMLEEPLFATDRALQRAGMTMADIDLYEVNEAFASVPLAWLKHTGADPEKLNVNGGAIALGHPIGATGSILIGTVIDELERRGGRYGLVTMCAAGGMAPAIIVERVDGFVD